MKYETPDVLASFDADDLIGQAQGDIIVVTEIILPAHL
jgi:hypothetical protein